MPGTNPTPKTHKCMKNINVPLRFRRALKLRTCLPSCRPRASWRLKLRWPLQLRFDMKPGFPLNKRSDDLIGIFKMQLWTVQLCMTLQHKCVIVNHVVSWCYHFVILSEITIILYRNNIRLKWHHGNIKKCCCEFECITINCEVYVSGDSSNGMLFVTFF